MILKNVCAMIKNNDKKRNDLFLGAVLFLAAAVLFLGQHVFREKGAAIQVLVKDEEFGTYPLSEDQEIPIGEGNILAISGGEAFMKWADCPDKLCIHQGKISHTGETIACLPNPGDGAGDKRSCLKCGQHCWIRRERCNKKSPAFYGVLASLALIASYVESLVPLPVPVPGIRLRAGQCGGSGGAGALRLWGGFPGVCGSDSAFRLPFWKSFQYFLQSGGRAFEPSAYEPSI